MKKITLISLIIFALIIGYIFIANVIAKNSSPSIASNTPPTINNIPNQTNSTSTPSNSNNSTPATSNSNNSSTITLTEIAKHSSPSDCYLVINKNVYNVSTFINSHPGGVQNITSKCGQEVTGIFAQIHSNRAWDLLAKYKIGTIAQN